MAKNSRQVNVNTATMEEMSTVSRLGPVLAKRIIDGRPYETLDDLTKVNGIGPQSLEPMRPYLTVTSISEQDILETELTDMQVSKPKTVIAKVVKSEEEAPSSMTWSISMPLSIIVFLGIAGIVMICLRYLTTKKEDAA